MLLEMSVVDRVQITCYCVVSVGVDLVCLFVVLHVVSMFAFCLSWMCHCVWLQCPVG